MAQTESQLKNLEKRLRFGKERPPAKSPGRPRTADFSAAFREYVDQGKKPKELFDRILKHKPEVAMYYLAGKPLERTVTVNVESTIDQLAKAVVRLEKQGGTNLPTPPEQTPPAQS